MSPLLRPRHRR